MIRILGSFILILMILLFPPAVLALISNNAVLGDTTYPIKRGLELGILKIASVHPTTKAWFTIKRSERRFKEVTILLAAGNRTTVVSQTLSEFINHTQVAADEVVQIKDGSQKKEYIKEFKQSIQKYKKELQTFKNEIVAESSPAVSPLEPTPFTPTTIPTVVPAQPTKQPRASEQPTAVTPSPTTIRHTPSPTLSPSPSPSPVRSIPSPTPTPTPPAALPSNLPSEIEEVIDDLDDIDNQLNQASDDSADESPSGAGRLEEAAPNIGDIKFTPITAPDEVAVEPSEEPLPEKQQQPQSVYQILKTRESTSSSEESE